MSGSLKTVATSGSYSDLTSKPTIGLPITADTGWTANASSGSKTVAVQNYASSGISGTMVTALNTVSTGLGTSIAALASQVQDLTNKVQALETALAASKIPNS